jgi:hypothetical protein
VGGVNQVWINWTVTAFMVSSFFEMRSTSRRLKRLEERR